MDTGEVHPSLPSPTAVRPRGERSNRKCTWPNLGSIKTSRPSKSPRRLLPRMSLHPIIASTFPTTSRPHENHIYFRYAILVVVAATLLGGTRSLVHDDADSPPRFIRPQLHLFLDFAAVNQRGLKLYINPPEFRPVSFPPPIPSSSLSSRPYPWGHRLASITCGKLHDTYGPHKIRLPSLTRVAPLSASSHSASDAVLL